MNIIRILLVIISLNTCGNSSEKQLVKTESKVDKTKNTVVSKVDSIHNGQDSLIFDLDYLMGKFEPTTHPDFMEIPIAYADQKGRLIRKDVFSSFKRMHDAAAKEGIKLIIKSATRNFNYQKGIWERKWTGETIMDDGTKASDIKNNKDRALKILRFSSMPGTSRHHWGTDIDLNAFENSYFETTIEGKMLYQWMTTHALEYGFCQVYDNKSKTGRSGYNEEKWHWSYIPVANKLLHLAQNSLHNEMIQGFLGDDTAGQVDMLNNYIKGVHDCD